MFGYIKPMVSELKVRENELYKSIYCGLCGAMGENICHSQRFTLSYDIVFLALARVAFTGESIHVEKKRCMVHPIKKRNRSFIPDTLKYCSQCAAVLTYFNIIDDINDSNKHKMLLPWAKKFLKKANVPDIRTKCEAYLNELSVLEKSSGSPDANADCFGRLLDFIFSNGLEDEKVKAAASQIGYHCGKWIYLIDACDDFEKDKKSGEYNPFSRYNELPREQLLVALTLELADAKKALDSIEVKNEAVHSILTNILTLGMPEVQDKIFKEKEKNE